MKIYDRKNIARLLRWSRERWLHDNTQPRDLDQLMLEASDALDKSVSRWWMYAWLAYSMYSLIAAYPYIRAAVVWLYGPWF